MKSDREGTERFRPEPHRESHERVDMLKSCLGLLSGCWQIGMAAWKIPHFVMHAYLCPLTLLSLFLPSPLHLDLPQPPFGGVSHVGADCSGVYYSIYYASD